MIYPAYVRIDLVDDSVEIYDHPARIELQNGGVEIITITKKDGVIEHDYVWLPGHKIKSVRYGMEVYE